MSSILRLPLAARSACWATLLGVLSLGGTAQRGLAAAEPADGPPGAASPAAADEEIVAPIAARSTRRVQRSAAQRPTIQRAAAEPTRRSSSSGNVMRVTLREEDEESAPAITAPPAASRAPAASPPRSPQRIQEMADDEERELEGIPDPAEQEMSADTPPPAPVDDESLPAASEEFAPEAPLPLAQPPARQRVAPPAADPGPPDPTTPVPTPVPAPAPNRIPATPATPRLPGQSLRQPAPTTPSPRRVPSAIPAPGTALPPANAEGEGEAVPVPAEAPLPPSPPAPSVPTTPPMPSAGAVGPPASPANPGFIPAPAAPPAYANPAPPAFTPTAPAPVPMASPAPQAPQMLSVPSAPPIPQAPLAPQAPPIPQSPMVPQAPMASPPVQQYAVPSAPPPYAGPLAPPAYPSAPMYARPNPPLATAPGYPPEPASAPPVPEYVPAPVAGTANPTYSPAPPAVLAPPPMVNRYPEEVEEEEMAEEEVEEEVEEEAEAYEAMPPPSAGYRPPPSNLRTDFYNFCRRACPPGLFFGSQLTMLSPLGETAPVVKLEDLVAERTIISDADGGLGVGSRTWIGFRNPAGSGFRVSYWNFNAEMNTPSPVVPSIAQPTTLDAYYLAAQTVDIELMNGFCFANGFLDISFGARYAKMDRNLTTLGYGEVGVPDAKVSLYSVGSIANSVDGLGFTASIGGRNLLLPMDCPPGPGPACGPLGVSFFWNVRGSILWSETEAFARTEAHAFTKKFGGSTAFNSDSAYACTKDDMVGIGEMQIGFEYQRCLKHFPGFLTIRFAVEGQYWGAGSVSARSDSTAFLIGGPPLFGGAASATAFSEAGDLSLLGASVSATISF